MQKDKDSSHIEFVKTSTDQPNCEQMPTDNHKPYSGKLEEIPLTLSKINTIPYLWSILKFHNLPTTGTKDQLVMRVYLLRCSKTTTVTAREEQQWRDRVSLVYKTILTFIE